MENEKFQVRMRLKGAFSKAARENPYDPMLEPLAAILRRHSGSLHCKFDAFQSYINANVAHTGGECDLLTWTKAEMADPEKAERYKKIFFVWIKGEERLDPETADRVMADLLTLPEAHVERVRAVSFDRDKIPQPPFTPRQG